MQPEFILLYCPLNTETCVLQCCSVFLSPSSTLCESGFPFCWFFFSSMLPRKDQMGEVATLHADGPLLEAFHRHLSASSTASSVFVVLMSAIPPFSFDSHSHSCQPFRFWRNFSAFTQYSAIPIGMTKYRQNLKKPVVLIP